MAEEEDDYLSDKFLFSGDSESSSTPKTYSSLRKEAQKRASLKNEQNRTKSRRQRELESREEGLSKSLFERAKEDEAAGLETGSKALSMMLKMGFKPGQSLGNVSSSTSKPEESPQANTLGDAAASAKTNLLDEQPEEKPHHVTVPLPLNEWAGRKGIGLGKRTRSPSSAERTAKMAKMADEKGHIDFRDRVRHEYAERLAEGRLGPVQRTCINLDEKRGKKFNVLWLDPSNPDTFPNGLIDALTLHGSSHLVYEQQDESLQNRLRRQMQADALHENSSDSGTMSTVSISVTDQFSTELLEEATQFLRLQAQDRLQIVLSYLRERYNYCFWCGVTYKDEQEMETQCPGPEEDAHD